MEECLAVPAEFEVVPAAAARQNAKAGRPVTGAGRIKCGWGRG